MTIKYKKTYINSKYTCLFSDFGSPIIINDVDKFVNDYYVSKKTVEEAESEYQVMSINGILNKNNLNENDIDLLVTGDLQNQCLCSSLTSSQYDISSLNIYSACATFAEGIIVASNILSNNKSNVLVCTSAHNLVSEKQFRFPIEYGSIRKRVNSITASGSVCTLLSKNKSNIKVCSSTIGKVVNLGHKDTNDMGSAMAPSCALTIHEHLKDLNIDSSYYDVILTGDLGIYGTEIMKEYYKKLYNEELTNVIDAGSIFYTDNKTYAGASGPACSPLILFDYILKNSKYKKILLVSTGSLHSVTSSNLKLPMRSVSHAVSLEVI